MTVSSSSDGFWQISMGTPAEVLAEIRDHCVDGDDIGGIAVDVSSKYHVLLRCHKGKE